jgi:hypothetical protein
VSMQELESLRLQIGDLLDRAGSTSSPVQPKAPSPTAPAQTPSRNRGGVLEGLFKYLFN